MNRHSRLAVQVAPHIQQLKRMIRTKPDPDTVYVNIDDPKYGGFKPTRTFILADFDLDGQYELYEDSGTTPHGNMLAQLRRTIDPIEYKNLPAKVLPIIFGRVGYWKSTWKNKGYEGDAVPGGKYPVVTFWGPRPDLAYVLPVGYPSAAIREEITAQYLQQHVLPDLLLHRAITPDTYWFDADRQFHGRVDRKSGSPDKASPSKPSSRTFMVGGQQMTAQEIAGQLHAGNAVQRQMLSDLICGSDAPELRRLRDRVDCQKPKSRTVPRINPIRPEGVEFRSQKSLNRAWDAMRQSRRQARLARILVADPQQTMERVRQKYPGINQRILALIASEVPEQALEWVVTSMANGSGKWPEDRPRFLTAWKNFQTQQGNQKFKQALQQVNPQTRNPLNFTLHQIETAESTATQPAKSKRKEIREVKQKGARLIAQADGFRCYEVTTPEAACYYAKNTRWCTSDHQTAKDYLAKGPLYVFVDEDGDKVAQFSLADSQFMDEIDVGIPNETVERLAQILPPPLRREVLTSLTARQVKFDLAENKPIRPQPPEVLQHLLNNPDLYLVVYYADQVMKRRWPEAEAKIFSLAGKGTAAAGAAVLYAEKVIKGRWLEAEPIIMKDAHSAVKYAENVIKGRWPEAEPIILEDANWARWYARDVIKGRWLEAEPIILKTDGDYGLFDYAKDVIKGRWPEAEPILLRDPRSFIAKEYTKLFLTGAAAH